MLLGRNSRWPATPTPTSSTRPSPSCTAGSPSATRTPGLPGRGGLMAAKYELLTRHLEDQPADEPVSLSFDQLARLVGGLPASAATYRSWWGDTWSNPHAAAWLRAGRKITAVQPGYHVVFSRADADTDAPPRATTGAGGGTGWAPIADGVAALGAALRQAGYPSVVHAVAAHTVFLHPDTVAQATGEALFPVVRDMSRRYQ